MKNVEIMEQYKMMNGISDSTELLSFQEWRKKGYSVKKGETSHHKVKLWKRVKTKTEDENGKEVVKSGFIMKVTALFEVEQVEPLRK